MKKEWFRKHKKRWIAVGVAVVLVVVGVGGFIIMRPKRQTASASTSVQTATAEIGSVSTTVTGTGTVEMSDTEDIQIPYGVKVTDIYVESGDTVSKGQRLAKVDKASVASVLLEVREQIDDVNDEIDDISGDTDDEDTEAYLEYQVLKGELSDLKEAKATLKSLMSTELIKASSDGIIASVNVTTDESSSSDSSSSTSTGTITGTTTGSSGSSLTATTVSAKTAKTTTGHAVTAMRLSSAAVSENATVSEATTEDSAKTAAETTTEASTTEITSCSVSVTAPTTGAAPQTAIDDGDGYTGTISWNCSGSTFKENTEYTATIKLTAKDGYVFAGDIEPEVAGATVEYKLSDNNEKLTIYAKFETTAAASTESSQTTAAAAETGQATTQSQEQTTQSANTKKNQSATTPSTQSGQSATGISGISGSSSVTSSASSDTTTTTTSSESIYETTAFTIASGSEVKISISIDELDVLSVAEDQSVTVTLDALEDQEFTGTISEVSQTASGSNGSVKYTAEVTLEKTDDMLIGMSASAVINVEEATNVVVIPANALQEKQGSSFVYTEKDDEGNLSGETEVETGLSDGTNVEIKSGLDEGDIVYYTKTGDTSSDSIEDMMQGGNFSGGEMPSGGGDMPSGGGQGGGPGNGGGGAQ